MNGVVAPTNTPSPPTMLSSSAASSRSQHSDTTRHNHVGRAVAVRQEGGRKPSHHTLRPSPSASRLAVHRHGPALNPGLPLLGLLPLELHSKEVVHRQADTPPDEREQEP